MALEVALQAGVIRISALASSLRMDPAHHLTGDRKADFSALAFTHYLARHLLTYAVFRYDVATPSRNAPATVPLGNACCA